LAATVETVAVILLTWTVGLPGSSHAETTFTGRRNVGIDFDVNIVQTSVKSGTSTTRNENVRFRFTCGNLVWLSGTEKGRSHSQDERKQDGKDWLLHV
jgi:hypothetical protein